jgi:PucR family transcriptional regulator, purine catabolism regulatory protein
MKGVESADLDISGLQDAETVPLAWLLDRGDLGLLVHHLPDRSVHLEWAHAIEVDDPAPWLHGRGLVLTTGLRLPRTKQGQEEYVARLVAAGATALGFGTGMRFAAIPFAVAAACRSHDLALVEVPLPTPFLAVVQALTDRLGELRRLRLVETLTDQRRLTRATLRDGVPGLVGALARRLGASVVAVGADGAVVATVGGLDAREVLAEVADQRGAVRVADPVRVLEIQPLGGQPADPLGWLAVGRRTPLTSTDRLLLSHAVSIATIELARPAAGPEVALGAAVLTALLAGTPLDAGSALTAAGIDPAGRLALVGIRGVDARAVERTLSVVRRQRRLVDAPTDDPRTRLALVTADDVDAFLAALPAALTAATGPASPLGDVASSAAAVLRLLGTLAPGDRAHVASDPAARVAADPVLRSAVDPWLGALASHDAAHASGLTDALRAFLTHHGSWDPAAQSLGVHRHTLRHRVERAAAVAGFDLDDPGHRALLALALG